jgi:hypothetical protein
LTFEVGGCGPRRTAGRIYMTSTAHAERGCPSGKVHGHACAYRTGAQHTAHVGIARELSDPKKASPRRGRAAATESRERPSETRDGRRDPTRAERTTAQASRPGRRCSARDVELPCSFRCARHKEVWRGAAAPTPAPWPHARRPRLYAQATLSRGVAKRARRVRVRVRRRLPSGGAAVDCPVMGRRSDSHDRCCAR